MTISNKTDEDRVLRFTTDIVSSYLRRNSVDLAAIPELVDVVHKKISDIYVSGPTQSMQQVPAIEVAASVTPDHIVCLEDGKKFKMLKKHLRTQYDMSPEEYRIKWKLPMDYPMVAPNYAVKRQELARASGLGKSRTKAS